jgi:cobalt-zinc-cadmium efflux system outer membrane protein
MYGRSSILSAAMMLSASAPAMGCASSPYDRAWLDKAVTDATGHAPGKEKPSAPSVPPGVRDVGALTADDAVATALWNNARFQVELTRLGFSRADLAEAGALPNPTLSFLLPIGPRQAELSATYPIAVLVQRPFRVAAAKGDVERTARNLVEVALDLVRDVRLAHAEAMVAARRVAMRREVEQSWTAIAKLTEARQRAGDASELELRAARAEALGAGDLTTRAASDDRLAQQRLRRLLGLAQSPLGDRVAVAQAPIDPELPPPADTLVKDAFAARPDVRGAEMAIEAAGSRLGWERAKVLQLFARLDVKPIGTRGGAPSLLLPGATVDIPIFNWNPGGRARAEAEINQASFRYLAVRDDVATEVRIAREQLEQALTSLLPWREKVLPLLDANVVSAMKAYESGNETYLLVLDSTRRAQDAKLRALDLEVDVLRARAALARAVGRRHA